MIIGASGGGSGIFFILIIGFLLLYLLVVRPQKRRQAQQQQLVNELRVGDEVLTAGGIYGTISQIDDDRDHGRDRAEDSRCGSPGARSPA